MRRFLLSLGLLILSLCLLPLLTGCGVGFVTPNIVESQAQNGAPIYGSLYGGHQSIVGAHIHLLAAGTSGYGSVSTSLLTSGTSGTDTIGGYVTPAADGTFSISGDYTCAPGQELYLLATGGNSQGDPNGPINPSIALAAAFGVCPGSGSLSPISVTLNEVSTVALAYALAPFATDATLDGGNGLWTLTQVPTSNDPLAPTISTLSGFTRSGTSLFAGHTFPYNMTSLAVDGSGNLWIASPATTTIYEIVGLTAPVVTPISVATAHNTVATRP